MADNLPLIPNKYGGCAGDVRPVLRSVFRERAGAACSTRLPPLQTAAAAATSPSRSADRDVRGASDDCEHDDADSLFAREEQLRVQRARRLARPPPLHLYTLHEPLAPPTTPPPPDEHALLQRSDLMPRIDQNAIRRETLWIKNILNQSSGDGSALKVTGARIRSSAGMLSANSEYRSAQSMSIGELVARVKPPAPRLALPQERPLSPPGDYIVCIPTSVNFINFIPGELYTFALRLVNMSKKEIQLSVRPPQRRELDLQLCGRLKVTSGATTDMLVHFKPPSVRSVYDQLLVRVSIGRDITVPISCYIEAPTLDVVMPNMTLSLVSGAMDGEGAPSYVFPESTSSENSAGGAVASTGSVGTRWAEAITGPAGAGGEVLDLGARLLGDVHHSLLLLRCALDQANFFILTEDAWFSHELSDVCEVGALVAGAFAVSPAWWRGGGEVRGGAWCRARKAGLHTVALRVLADTAVTRPLHLIADALYFYPEHVRLKAQEKNYDICSDDDPDCEFYVSLGTTFQHQSLAGSVLIINHSPLTFPYYWCVRAWGECSCWQEKLGNIGPEDDPEHLCPGAREARKRRGKADSVGEEAAAAVLVEPAQGIVLPRATAPVRIMVPNVGERVGIQRAVLVLVLRDIPEKSFPQGFYPMIVSTYTKKTKHIPGFKREDRVYCDVVCCQLEVWWHVTPLQFVLDPPYVHLPCSRRIRSVELQVRATQLFAGGCVRAQWRASRAKTELPAAVQLRVAQPQQLVVRLPLVELPNEFSTTETITLEEERGRWSAISQVERWSATRHPALRPVCTWLGVVPPRQHMNTHLKLTNDTFQNIYWWGDVLRWLNEQWPKEVCQSRPEPCKTCFEECCTCNMLRPARGAVKRSHSVLLGYNVNAPSLDGCVATLIRVRRTEPGTAHPFPEAPVCARASLIAYRVLDVRLTIHVLSCSGDTPDCNIGCALDSSCCGAGSGGLLRPARALVAGLRSCYRLRITNLTPIRTRVHWGSPPDGERLLRIIFIPNEFDVDGFEEIDVRVVLEARLVCARRVWTRQANVRHAVEPLYLIIDTAISGLEVDYWLPLPDYSFCLRLKQREMFLWQKPLPTTLQEAFEWEDAKRAVIDRSYRYELFADAAHYRNSLHYLIIGFIIFINFIINVTLLDWTSREVVYLLKTLKNICHCALHMRWVSPLPTPERPPGVATPPIPVVTTPPPLTRTCKCFARARPLRPSPEPLALEVRELLLRTVHTLRVRLRSVCPLAARWSACARLGALKLPRVTLTAERWASRVRECGLAVHTSPARGVLGARAVQDIELRVYADTWGLYQDQILILVEGLEPLLLNLWVEAIGCPLQFALRPGPAAGPYADNAPVLWVSESDPSHVVRARNASRAPLLLHAYLLRDHEHVQDEYPFRLCIRFFDLPPPTCPCHYTYDQSMVSIPVEEQDLPSISSVTMDTGFEVFLAPDYGIQDSEFFKVEPVEQEVVAGKEAQWAVTALGPAPSPPAHTLIIRIQPLAPQGPWWYRGEPAPAVVRLRSTVRGGALQLSHDVVIAHLSALALPLHELMRVRKRLCVQNVGDGRLLVSARVRKEKISVVIPSTILDVEELGEGAEGAEGEKDEEYEGEHVSFKKPSADRQLWSGDTGTVSRAGDLYQPSQLEDTPRPSLQPPSPEWSVMLSERHGDCGIACIGKERAEERMKYIELTLPAHSTIEICVEVCVNSEEVCPLAWEGVKDEVEGEGAQAPPLYDQDVTYTSHLEFYDDDNVLKRVPLVLQLEMPRLLALPHLLELGYVCDGDTRKSYFTISHTSRTDTISVSVQWSGGEEFRVHPSYLLLPPSAKQNVYVMYSGRFTGAAVSEGWAIARAAGAAGAWCCAAVRVRALASRDFKCHLPPHDHTDDPKLLPPDPTLRALLL